LRDSSVYFKALVSVLSRGIIKDDGESQSKFLTTFRLSHFLCNYPDCYFLVAIHGM